uniref:Uncharacterized protein n=1 Tax=Tetraselmis sp. GSL018 TaxID=582737 RepID=A0A061QZN5_9CHLO
MKRNDTKTDSLRRPEGALGSALGRVRCAKAMGGKHRGECAGKRDWVLSGGQKEWGDSLINKPL